MTEDYVSEQLSVSTAEQESFKVTGGPMLVSQPVYKSGFSPLVSGQYRVVAGQLYRVEPGVPLIHSDDES